MVKVAFVSAAVAILAPLAAADNCRNGLRYCGHNLLDLGKNIFSPFIIHLIFNTN